MRASQFAGLGLLTIAAILVHGYHPGVEDAEIYLPGVEKILHPDLFPFNAKFFESHAHLTLFPNLIAASVRLTHLSLPTMLLLWQVTSVFLLLWGCWQLTAKCFANEASRWAGVTMIACLLTLPVAGTALYIMDEYLNPRNLTAFTAVFAIAKFLDKKYVPTLLFLAFAALIHPLMSAFVLSFCALLFVLERYDARMVAAACLLPFGFFDPPSPAYHQVALSHAYHYPMRWHWYEWLGVVGPILILAWFSRIARSRNMRNLELLSRALVIYELIYIAAGLIVSVPARFESLARLQPMRSLYLFYILFVLFAGALIGDYFLKNRLWRWLTLFVPLALGMFLAQRSLFPNSAHIEWPWAQPKNRWVEAFDWIRNNTPENAIFALDPFHMEIPGEDENGFRAIAQRSMLADAVKDSGAVTMFPPMAEEWLQQVQAQRGWRNFQAQDFRRLQTRYGVDWVVLQQPGVPGLECPYRNDAVVVCRLL